MPMMGYCLATCFTWLFVIPSAFLVGWYSSFVSHFRSISSVFSDVAAFATLIIFRYRVACILIVGLVQLYPFAHRTAVISSNVRRSNSIAVILFVYGFSIAMYQAKHDFSH
ncbi:MAG: hypothetical protein LBB91_07120, partial [Clostridiales bacterium]|nr:hypothetical protein [Clostridiales bacterium]